MDVLLALELGTNNFMDSSGKDEDSMLMNQIFPPAKVHRRGVNMWNEYFRCAGKHKPSKCKFQELQSYRCEKKGHVEKICLSEEIDKKNQSKGEVGK